MIKIFKITFSLFLYLIPGCSAQTGGGVDSLEFQKGYPKIQNNALEQLRTYPSPRYKTNNQFLRLFNWMSPHYMAGKGQKSISIEKSIKEAVLIQEELAKNWNYSIVLPNPSSMSSDASFNNPKNPYKAYVEFANKHPELPLVLTTFWVQSKPSLFGYPYEKPNITRQDLPGDFYILDKAGTRKWKTISYAAPDSLFINDGIVVKKNIETILKHLTRPINMINENGEEPPHIREENILKEDPVLLKEKEKLKIASWSDYVAIKKTYIRKLYASQFMSLPELKNTFFTVYNVEGGPIDRFDWHYSKSTCSKIKGNYYSTPDFYPRTPDNWRTWKGAWHGWKWINDGRKVEIKDGDKFFSPYVAAGWAFNPEKDIRPAQWLGLLKCLAAVGAEFYYAGYFNLKAPFSLPENYVWQAAMPAYAQAVTTYYADVFFDGNVLFEGSEPVITYPVKDEDILVTVRKHDTKEKYVIALSLQPVSNSQKSPLKKNVEIKIGNHKLKIEARRQGSVYVYDESVSPAVFYQIDRWHQYQHPSRWRKEWINEAEVIDSSSSPLNALIRSEYKQTADEFDFTSHCTYVNLKEKNFVQYTIPKRECMNDQKKNILYLLVKCPVNSELSVKMDKDIYTLPVKVSNEWIWIKQELHYQENMPDANVLQILLNKGELLIDKMVLMNEDKLPDLSDY